MFERNPQKLFPHDHLMRYTVIPLIPTFITPNMVTVFRMIMTPVVLWFLYLEQFTIGVPIFLFVAFTDAMDGSLARLRNQITQWGTFYDPLADKILISSVILLVVVQHVNVIFGVLILGIEALLLIGGCIKKMNGKIIGSNIFGKTKMFLQVTGVLLLLIALWAGFDLFIPLSVGTLSLAIVFAVISLFTYGL
ncbi:MAG: CDP-alcohol phosphatidyltransferase [Candidatus Uhrbacteria bacterium GW2011_GWF2_39_13]|uniref:CDP-alcohol phosphatidyltransferase n=1 Tax=Candidatus Uhrbacteria bacterium GW2011_GWF2_39_13 TaxID=1618995 RepID=A0A0G0Q1Y6_9BACT|nr:MAG: CDP-alcohol phosphatidyltransferase [Candidatus Uhrbacteria bacterium GW2011_GWF2_39_13]